jgi:hypothetical protein
VRIHIWRRESLWKYMDKEVCEECMEDEECVRIHGRGRKCGNRWRRESVWEKVCGNIWLKENACKYSIWRREGV